MFFANFTGLWSKISQSIRIWREIRQYRYELNELSRSQVDAIDMFDCALCVQRQQGRCNPNCPTKKSDEFFSGEVRKRRTKIADLQEQLQTLWQ